MGSTWLCAVRLAGGRHRTHCDRRGLRAVPLDPAACALSADFRPRIFRQAGSASESDAGAAAAVCCGPGGAVPLGRQNELGYRPSLSSRSVLHRRHGLPHAAVSAAPSRERSHVVLCMDVAGRRVGRNVRGPAGAAHLLNGAGVSAAYPGRVIRTARPLFHLTQSIAG